MKTIPGMGWLLKGSWGMYLNFEAWLNSAELQIYYHANGRLYQFLNTCAANTFSAICEVVSGQLEMGDK